MLSADTSREGEIENEYVHGHTNTLRIFLEGELDDKLHWVMDFADIKRLMDPILRHVAFMSGCLTDYFDFYHDLYSLRLQ